MQFVAGTNDAREHVEQRLFVDLGCRRLDKPIDFDELESVVLEIIGPQP